MAITYNWINPHGGSWNDAANWNPSGGPQTAPVGPPADNATFATGSSRPYTVTGQGYGSQILISGDHVTFDHFQGFSSWTGGDLTVENGGLLKLSSDSSIVLINHDGMAGGGPFVSNGTLISDGRITAQYGIVDIGGRLVFAGPAASGYFASLAGVRVAHGGYLGVRDGAQFTANGAKVDGRAIVTGAGSQLVMVRGTIAADGLVISANGGLLELPGTLVQGQIRLNGGTMQGNPGGDPTTIVAGGRLSGHGMIFGQFNNNGAVAARDGLLTIDGPVTGTGSLAIGSRSTLELGSDTSETIRFRGFDARLMLDHNIAAHGFLGGFSPGDSIDLAGTTVTSIALKASGHDTLLTAYDHDAVVASFDIGGRIPQGAIALSDDGAGGTLLTYGGCGASVWNDVAQGSSQDMMHAVSHA